MNGFAFHTIYFENFQTTFTEFIKRFTHDVKLFLDDYLDAKNCEWAESDEKHKQESQSYIDEFINMLNFVKQYFPNGFRKTGSSDNKISRIRC